MSISDAEYVGKRKQTWRKRFLAEMEQMMLWQSWLLALIKPLYPMAGNGRPPYSLETILQSSGGVGCRCVRTPLSMRPSSMPQLD